jgi:hypothetical protein
MTTTNPYFIRDQLTDTPGHKGPNWSSCPDIIFSTSGSPNWVPQMGSPSSYITATGYGTDYGSTVQADGKSVNYVYLRALNTNPGANIPTRLWFMFTESDLALWPQRWRKDGIMVGNQQAARNYQDGVDIMSGGPGPYVVTQQPFLWVVQPPSAGNHYCCISMAEPFPNADPDNSLSDPPFAPPSTIGSLSTWDQLAQFVLTTNWFGWRNTTDVSTLGQTWTQVIPVTGPDEGGTVNVGIQCVNMPTDGFVSATMAGPNPQNSLNLPKTQIKLPNMNLFVPITLPPSFKTNMVINYWQGPTAPPYMATIAPLLQLPSSSVAALLQGRAPNRPPSWSRVHDPVTMQFQGWQRVHTIGSVPLVWQTPPRQQLLRGLVAMPRRLPEALAPARDPGSTWQRTWTIEAPPEGGTLFVGVHCTNMAGGEIAVLAPGEDPENSMDLPPTAIEAPSQYFLTLVDWPPNFATVVTVVYWGPELPEGADVTPVVVRPSAGGAPRSDTALPAQKTVPVTSPIEAGTIYAGIQTINLPTDGFVACSVPDPGGFELTKTQITVAGFEITDPLEWPAGRQFQMTMSYWPGPTEPPAGAEIVALLYRLKDD